jgi:hypothetical protein
MPTSTLRHLASRVSVPRYPFLRYPFATWPYEVDDSGNTNIAVTPGASNVEGTAVETKASLADDCDLIVCQFLAGSKAAGDTSTIWDIMTDASLATAVVSDWAGGAMINSLFRLVAFPVHIAKGTRVGIRGQCANATPVATSVRMWFYRFPYGLRSPASLVAMGVTTASSKGTSLGTSDNTYVQITAATTEAFQALVVGYGHDGDTTMSTNTGRITIGVGAGGSEVAVGNHVIGTSTAEAVSCAAGFLNMGLIAGHIPAGARLAAKSSICSTDGTDITLHGVPYA